MGRLAFGSTKLKLRRKFKILFCTLLFLIDSCRGLEVKVECRPKLGYDGPMSLPQNKEDTLQIFMSVQPGFRCIF